MANKILLKPEIQKEKFQFINSMYFRPKYNKLFKEEFGEAINDFLAIIYRDEETDEKKLKIMRNPKIQFFVANSDVHIEEDQHLSQIELDKVHIEQVQYKHLLRYLCQLQDEWNGTHTDFSKFYRNGKESNGTIYEANKFHLFNRVFSSDIDIEDYWKGRFLQAYPNATNTKITKAYTDIEVDSINISGFPNEDDALCPINAITVFFEERMTFFTLLLRNDENPKIAKYEKNLKKHKKKLKETFGSEFNFKIKFFDDELEMIQYYFALNNLIKPDFNLIWNMRYDIGTLLNRIGELEGFDRFDREQNRKYDFQELCAEYCCPDDFPDYLKRSVFVKDNKNQKASDRIDVFNISSFTQWLDQLSLYASIRKGMGELESMALSFVAQKEVDDDKLNYMESGYNIKTLPYDDYEMFVTYNIKDVLLLYKIENKNEDVNLLYSIAETTKTRLSKAMRKTVSIKNMAYHFYIDQGYVQGNNSNISYGSNMENDEDNEKFEGAFVADPMLNGNNGVLINGTRSKFIYDFVIDFDYSALYPSIIRTFNIDANAQYGRIIFEGNPPSKEYDMGGDFMDNLETKNIIYLTNKFLGTPTINDIVDKCKSNNLI